GKGALAEQEQSGRGTLSAWLFRRLGSHYCCLCTADVCSFGDLYCSRTCFLRRISVRNRCGHPIRKIWKDQINYRKNMGGTFIWCAGVYASYPCRICNSPCCLWD